MSRVTELAGSRLGRARTAYARASGRTLRSWVLRLRSPTGRIANHRRRRSTVA